MKHKSLESMLKEWALPISSTKLLAQAIRDYALSEWVVEEDKRTALELNLDMGGEFNDRSEGEAYLWGRNTARAEQIRKIRGE